MTVFSRGLADERAASLLDAVAEADQTERGGQKSERECDVDDVHGGSP
jgi:hypothetical protein